MLAPLWTSPLGEDRWWGPWRPPLPLCTSATPTPSRYLVKKLKLQLVISLGPKLQISQDVTGTALQDTTWCGNIRNLFLIDLCRNIKSLFLIDWGGNIRNLFFIDWCRYIRNPFFIDWRGSIRYLLSTNWCGKRDSLSHENFVLQCF